MSEFDERREKKRVIYCEWGNGVFLALWVDEREKGYGVTVWIFE